MVLSFFLSLQKAALYFTRLMCSTEPMYCFFQVKQLKLRFQMVTSFQDGCRLANGNLVQPLNVNTFLCPEPGSLTDASGCAFKTFLSSKWVDKMAIYLFHWNSHLSKLMNRQQVIGDSNSLIFSTRSSSPKYKIPCPF